jgi:hypothetical protein
VNFTVLLALGFGSVLVVVVASWIADRPEFGVPLVACASVAAFSQFNPVLVSVAGLNVFSMDVVTGVLLGALLIQMGGGRRFSRAAFPWAGLGLIAVIALLRGISRYGVEVAFQSLRPTIHIISVAAFFASQTRRFNLTLSMVRRIWLVASAALAVVAIVFIVRFGMNRFGAEVDRPLNAPQALIVLQTLLMVLQDRARWRTPMSIALGLLVVLSQQRTVWIGAVVTLFLTWFVMAPEGRQKRQLSRAAGAFVAAFALLLLVFPTSTVGQAAQRAVTEPFNSRNTFIWRVAGWDSLISRQLSGPLVDLGLGNPAGAGSARRLPSALGGGLVEVSAHSQWVTELLLGGVLAVVLFAAATVLPTIRSWILDRSNRRPALLTAAAIAALIFTVSYQLYPEQGVIFGTIGVVVANRRSRRDPTKKSAPHPIGAPG